MAARAQPPGITAVPIWGDDGSGSGPTPPATEDRFEASILVGNTANGDSATAQAAPFQYVPDPGDGSGVRAALAVAAANPSTRYRIRVRPGLYTFPDGGAFPIEIPTNCTLEGSGVTRTVFRQQALNWNVFQLNAGTTDLRAELRDCTVNVSDLSSTGIPVGPFVVDVRDRGVCTNVRIYAQAQAGNVSWDNNEFFRISGTQPRLIDCIVIANLADAWQDLADAPPAVRVGRASTTTYRAQVRLRLEQTASGLTGGSAIPAIAVAAGTTVSSCDIDVSGGGGVLGTLRGTGHRVRFELIGVPPAVDQLGLVTFGLTHSTVEGVLTDGGIEVVSWSIDDASEYNTFSIVNQTSPGLGAICEGSHNDFTRCVGNVGATFTGNFNTIVGGQWAGESINFRGNGNSITGAHVEFSVFLDGSANSCVGCYVVEDITFVATGTNNVAVGNRYAGALTPAGTTPEIANNIQV